MAPWAPNAHGAQTYVQVKYSYTLNKTNNFLKNIKRYFPEKEKAPNRMKRNISNDMLGRNI